MTKKIVLFSIIGLLIVAIGFEAVYLNKFNKTIVNQKKTIENLKSEIVKINEQKDRELAEKVIIQTYKELSKTGNLTDRGTLEYFVNSQRIKENMELISDSYLGNDTDIKIMLTVVNGYTDYITNMQKSIDRFENLGKYKEAEKAVKKCISKYALFDKVGLNK